VNWKLQPMIVGEHLVLNGKD